MNQGLRDVGHRVQQWRGTEKILVLVPAGVAVAVFAVYALTYDIQNRTLFWVALVLIAVTVAATGAALLAGDGRLLPTGPLLALSSTALCGVGIEVTLRLARDHLPPALADYVAAPDLRVQQARMVEFLPHSPWAKFRPNTRIRSQGGGRGAPHEFVYEWATDQLGFKNPKALAAQRTVQAVALGDSFTEGMGVSVDDTWPSQLTRLGLQTYNLGVQGYAPSQMDGALASYGLSRHPRWVIIAYTLGTFTRETLFGKQRQSGDRRLSGGIAAIADEDQAGVRGQSHVMISALYLYARHALYELLHGVVGGTRRVRAQLLPAFRRYAADIAFVSARPDLAEAVEHSSREWTSTLSAFSEIVTMSRGIGARVVIVTIPPRGVVYYSAATAHSLPERYFGLVEVRELRKFAEQQGIVLVDPTNALRGYVSAIAPTLETSTLNKLPYISIDAHMNAIGYGILATEIARAIRAATTDSPPRRRGNSSGMTGSFHRERQPDATQRANRGLFRKPAPTPEPSRATANLPDPKAHT
jgi:hypothetical protein